MAVSELFSDLDSKYYNYFYHYLVLALLFIADVNSTYQFNLARVAANMEDSYIPLFARLHDFSKASTPFAVH